LQLAIATNTMQNNSKVEGCTAADMNFFAAEIKV